MWFCDINSGRGLSTAPCLLYQQSEQRWRKCWTCEVSESVRCLSAVCRASGPSSDPFPLAPETASRLYNNCRGNIKLLLRLPALWITDLFLSCCSTSSPITSKTAGNKREKEWINHQFWSRRFLWLIRMFIPFKMLQSTEFYIVSCIHGKLVGLLN